MRDLLIGLLIIVLGGLLTIYLDIIIRNLYNKFKR